MWGGTTTITYTPATATTPASISIEKGETKVEVKSVESLIIDALKKLNDKNLAINRRLVGNFNGTHLYVDDDLPFGAAYTLPGIGIHIDAQTYNDYIGNDPTKKQEAVQLLKHEFGHILQAEKYGKAHFYVIIATVSLLSASSPGQHQCTWTEREANKLSLDYYCQTFNDCFWNSTEYPISETDCNH